MNAKKYTILALYLSSILLFGCSTHNNTKVDNEESIRKSQERKQAALQAKINFNKLCIEKLQAYVTGQTTEDTFWKDGWNGRDPYEERIGVIAFKRRSGINQYTLGYYSGDTGNPTAISVALEVYSIFIEKENAEYDVYKIMSVGAPTKSVHVCELLFKNNLLEIIRFIK